MTLNQKLDQRLPLILAGVFLAWGAYMIYFKFRLHYYGLATDDLFNYLNALHNTNFWDKWLFTARYEGLRRLPSLLFNHWQPTFLILYPVAKLAGAEGLLVVQALAPLWAAVFLLKICEHIGLAPFERLFVIVICLFHPNLMAAIMDSMYGFHGTTLLLYFGAPMAWAAITGRWKTAVVLFVFFLNVRENAALYVAGAAVGALIFGNAYFGEGRRRMVIAVSLAVIVFVGGLIIAPMLAGVVHEHAAHAKSVITDPERMLYHLRRMDSDWHNLYLWMWPGFAALGTLFTIFPESVVLILAEKKASHWYGMVLVFAGSIAVAYGLPRVRQFAQHKGWGRYLSIILVLHMIAIMIGGPKEVRDQTRKLVTRIGVHIPAAQLALARNTIDDRCRTAVEFQAMKGFGDLPYLQYPRQAHQSRHLVTIPKLRSGMNNFVQKNRDGLNLLYEDDILKVFENPKVPCVMKFR